MEQIEIIKKEADLVVMRQSNKGSRRGAIFTVLFVVLIFGLTIYPLIHDGQYAESILFGLIAVILGIFYWFNIGNHTDTFFDKKRNVIIVKNFSFRKTKVKEFELSSIAKMRHELRIPISYDSWVHENNVVFLTSEDVPVFSFLYFGISRNTRDILEEISKFLGVPLEFYERLDGVKDWKRIGGDVTHLLVWPAMPKIIKIAAVGIFVSAIVVVAGDYYFLSQTHVTPATPIAHKELNPLSVGREEPADVWFEDVRKTLKRKYGNVVGEDLRWIGGGSQFLKDGQNLYWAYGYYKGVPGAEVDAAEMIGEVDYDTFEILGVIKELNVDGGHVEYVKDKNGVYVIGAGGESSGYITKAIPGADLKTFTPLNQSFPVFAKDVNMIYYLGQPMPEADVSTFGVLTYLGGQQTHFAKDKNAVFIDDMKLGAIIDNSTFQPVSDRFGKDKIYVYSLPLPEPYEFDRGVGAIVVDGADPVTFQQLDDKSMCDYNYGKDKSHVYKTVRSIGGHRSAAVVEGADPATYKVGLDCAEL